MTPKRTLLICLVILLVAAGLLALVFSTEPEAKRGGATKETAMLVEVVTAERGTYRPTIVAMGRVEPAREIVPSPRVGGEIIERSRAFDPGGFVDRGDVLVRIDPADYENLLAQRRGELAQALSDLDVEMGRQDIARKDYELLGDELETTVAPENESLVLREPQLEAAKARVEAARAAVAQAELDLERTRVRAPFDAHVLERAVDLGSQVAAGEPLGRLVGLETYWVVATVPLSKLRFLKIPDNPGTEGAAVRVSQRTAWPEGTTRAGRVDRLLGELADETRMARVLVTVEDPLGRLGTTSAGDDPEPPLMLGAFAEARIEGEPIDDVVRLDRDFVRQNDTVWVMDEDDRLSIRDVEIVFRDSQWAYVAKGIEEGEKIVKTNLATVTDGARLRLEGDESSDSETPENGAGS